VLSDGTANYVYGHERLRALGGPWYVGDALGSVRQTLDDAGAVVATTNYDPWGTPQGTLSTPFGFTEELHHPGQVYLRARWYAPGQGTFPSRDPFAGWATRPYSLHPYQYAYSNPVRWTDPSGRCVPEWVPGGEPGCTLRAGIGQGRLDWQGAGDYAWDVVQGVGLPGAMAVDAIAGTNGTQQILDDAGTGTYLGVAFTGVTTLGGLQSGGAIRNAALRGQVWLTSGSRLAVGVGLVGLGLNAADDGALWLRTMQGDCAAFGEWAALQQLGAADGLLPFGDVLAAGVLVMPGRRGFFSVPDNLGQLRPLNSGWQESVAGLRYGPDPNYGDRVQHVLRHATDNPLRTQPHGVFEGDALAIVDEAWLSAQMGGSHVQIQVQGNRMVYHIDMGRRIGYEGGQPGAAAGYPALHRVRIVVQNNNEVITAFPER